MITAELPISLNGMSNIDSDVNKMHVPVKFCHDMY